MMRAAIIDMGTNTFNLLIAESQEGGTFNVLLDRKLPVRLGAGGITQKIITPEAMDRGFRALEEHAATMKEFGLTHAKAFGTSAIRSARNGKAFADQVFQRFGFDVEIISGKREAELIYKGVKHAVQLTEQPVLILDIGGGSNEFIIGDRENIFWKKSYKLGVARLLEEMHPSDPITPEEITKAENLFRMSLRELYKMVPMYAIDTLIGASGSFETFSALLRSEAGSRYATSGGEASMEISLPDYFRLYEQLLRSTAQERSKMPGMEPIRVDYIVLASVFVSFVLREFSIKKLIQSNYALKEGVMAEWMEQSGEN
ncbi:MAG: Ppx/GppA family phosphatase [Bacteroidales bacterium]|nr:Ppx/GppA family phosphatase [Bacteroidales bacterium]